MLSAADTLVSGRRVSLGRCSERTKPHAREGSSSRFSPVVRGSLCLRRAAQNELVLEDWWCAYTRAPQDTCDGSNYTRGEGGKQRVLPPAARVLQASSAAVSLAALILGVTGFPVRYVFADALRQLLGREVLAVEREELALGIQKVLHVAHRQRRCRVWRILTRPLLRGCSSQAPPPVLHATSRTEPSPARREPILLRDTRGRRPSWAMTCSAAPANRAHACHGWAVPRLRAGNHTMMME